MVPVHWAQIANCSLESAMAIFRQHRLRDSDFTKTDMRAGFVCRWKGSKLPSYARDQSLTSVGVPFETRIEISDIGAVTKQPEGGSQIKLPAQLGRRGERTTRGLLGVT
jgi:hypothetical protein